MKLKLSRRDISGIPGNVKRRSNAREQSAPPAVDIANQFAATPAVKLMSPDDSKRTYRKDMLLASAMVAVGLSVIGVSVAQLRGGSPNAQMAQATQPLQSTPGAEKKPSAPAEPGTTGVRPSGVSPEPARPDSEAQKAGAAPALPPAPAEKTAAPIKER
jgi:hypothetical protein